MSVLHLFENNHSEGPRAQKFMENSQNEQKTWKIAALFGGPRRRCGGHRRGHSGIRVGKRKRRELRALRARRGACRRACVRVAVEQGVREETAVVLKRNKL